MPKDNPLKSHAELVKLRNKPSKPDIQLLSDVAWLWRAMQVSDRPMVFDAKRMAETMGYESSMDFTKAVARLTNEYPHLNIVATDEPDKIGNAKRDAYAESLEAAMKRERRTKAAGRDTKVQAADQGKANDNTDEDMEGMLDVGEDD